MKVYINGKFLNQEVTGVQRVAIRYLEELNKVQDFEFEILENNYNGMLSILYEQLILPIKSRNGLLISFCNTAPILKKEQILFLHDVAFLASNSHRGFFKFYYKVLIKILVNRLKNIITVSKFSKEEIVKYYGEKNREKIEVIYNGLDFGVAERKLNKFPKENFSKYKNIVLTVSSMDPRKRLKHIVSSWLNAENARNSLLLVVGGKNNAFVSENLETGNDNIIFTGYVSDSDLVSYYTIADYYVSASEYEGFGLPIAESLNHGCIPLLSDIPVHKEIYENYAYFFNNKTMELENIFNNLENLKINNFILSENFTWRSSAERLIRKVEKLENEEY